MSSLLYLHLFEEAMSSLPRQTRGFYLQENQPWEWAFISTWRYNKHANYLIGLPHSTVIYWDLRYFFDAKTYTQKDNLALPLPDKVGVNGDVAKAMYLNDDYPKDYVVEVEALRFLYLNTSNQSHQTTEKQTGKLKDLLILSDYHFKNVVVQMKLLQGAQTFMNHDIKYTLKPHPACPVKVDDFPEIELSITNKNINSLLNDYEVVYTGNVTSAAVEAYCLSKHVITVLDPVTLNLSPLKNNGGVSFVSTPKELAIALEKVFDERKKEGQHEEFFYLDTDLPRWKKLLNIKKI